MARNDFSMPEPRFYSHQDLFPFKRDPLCSRRIPLGNFWPVYVGNFWCDTYSQHANKVQEYFASKGLLVRMVFGRSAMDDPHVHHQQVVHLYDFLVYFVRQQDAEDAISYCHREMHYGHRLNVFPGRAPLYFDTRTTVKHAIQQPLNVRMTEQVFEYYIEGQCPLEVKCVVQHEGTSVIAEYHSMRDRNRAIQFCQFCKPLPIRSLQQKQRFIETDVQREICDRFRMDRSFIGMVPVDIILGSLFNGIRFNCYQWRYENKLLMPKQIRFSCSRLHRIRAHRSIFKSAAKHFWIKCACKHHVKFYARLQRRRDKAKSQPAIKPTKPLPSVKIQKEVTVVNASNEFDIKQVAVINASNESDIKPAIIVVQAPAPAVNLRNRSVAYNFFEDSQNIDSNLGIQF